MVSAVLRAWRLTFSNSGPRLFWRDYGMRNEFTAVIERDGDWFVAWSPEIPGANGQGRTLEECRENLASAIQLILEDRREDGLRGIPDSAVRDIVTVQ
jgi:predicted RNase H-like HicB family nuclease